MAVTQKNRILIYGRDSERCCACGRFDSKTINHRVNRQSGGSDNRDNMGNLATMCNGCNNALESSSFFRQVAVSAGWLRLIDDDSEMVKHGGLSFKMAGIALGWKLQTWEDPLRTAVYFRWAREWRLLDDQGTYEVVEQRDIRTVLEGMDF
jgi:hypothetical protein